MNLIALILIAALGACLSSALRAAPLTVAGAARVDITPEYSIRLNGYGSRRAESSGVAQRLFAKALALGAGSNAVVVLTVDNCGLSAAITDGVASRIERRTGLPRERIAICSTHTHSAPMISGVLSNLFSADIPDEQWHTIDRFTRDLVAKLELVALTALSNGEPATITWGEGRATFARNRRVVRGAAVQFGENPAAPVDHSLPVLRVTSADGTIRALWANYACHCTTLGGEFNQLHGDWAGHAQEFIEQDHPGAVALVSIGCGADANPAPRGKPEHAEAHGREIAMEVRRLAGLSLTPLPEITACRLDRISLAFDPLPTRAQWEERAQKPGIVGYHARKNLTRLDAGQTLPTHLPYPVQTWRFATNLAVVFLAGEVVVDYQLRLKRELDGARLWINGYANDVPCYIPSARILREGGYEAEDSLWYYDRPARLAPDNEELIIRTVHEHLPNGFETTNRNAMPPPLSPKEALNSFQLDPSFAIEAVATEPLVIDPVAIDFGSDGRLWVVEMHDYPMGVDGQWKPGGRVKFLEDTNSDGRFDKATVFLDDLPFPTGVFAWRKGVLVSAAPDILYAEDTNDDGRADRVRKIFSGFETGNYQARVNSLSLGLDNWIHGANGLLGGVIAGTSGTNRVNIRGRDFRMHPDTGAFEPVAGLTQQGRVRDDFGNWFGCDNTHLLWHYPLPDHYLRRNPHVSSPAAAVNVPRGKDWSRVFPTSVTLERFNDPHTANRVTSACGLEIYRDTALGTDLYGNAFTCEPVHNLVHREVLTHDGVLFRSDRADSEAHREFLASTDHWFRPAQVRTGPDGALWIVDMYRFVIEHPRWIPSNRLAQLDVRAGDDKGRIYRVTTRNMPPRPMRNFSRMATIELASALDSTNGAERDIIHRELLNRNDRSAIPALERIFQQCSNPAVRVQALSILDGLSGLTRDLVLRALADANAAVRVQAVRCSERWLHLAEPSVIESVALLARDPALEVRFQLALSAGEIPDASRTANILRALLPDATRDSYFRSALLSSAIRCATPLLEAAANDVHLFPALIKTIVGNGNEAEIESALTSLLSRATKNWSPTEVTSLVSLIGAAPTVWARHRAQAESVLQFVRSSLDLTSSSRELAAAGIQLLVGTASTDAEWDRLGALLKPNPWQEVAVKELSGAHAPEMTPRVIAAWTAFTPVQRALVLEQLAARRESTALLLRAIEENHIAASEVPLALRTRFLQHNDHSIRIQANRLWAERHSDRLAVMQQFRPHLNPAGVPARGRAVFDRVCASCHTLDNRGYAVGPDLAPLRNKSPEDFLLAIIDPNAAIEPRFVQYHVELHDGRTLSGVVRSETATSLTMMAAGGMEETVLRSDVLGIRAAAVSLMPEGLEQGITPIEMNDLISFLRNNPSSRPLSRLEQN